jgi:hypothetical protein
MAKSILFEDIARTVKFTKGGKLKKILMCIREPGVHAVTVLRYGQWAAKKPLVFRVILDPLYFLAYFLILALWGIEIPRGTKIGGGSI